GPIGLRKSLFKVRDDVVNVLCADGQTNHILSDTAGNLFVVLELLVGSRPGVDCESLGVTDAARDKNMSASSFE
ncbi:hypothetical protein KEM55_000111, partial [Ascosphaera atra]